MESTDAKADSGIDVCTLSEEKLAARIDMIRKEILPHVRRSEELDHGYAWEYDATPEMRARLERLVELERECCSAWSFDLRSVAESNALRLEVRGVDPNSGLLEVLGGPPSAKRGERGHLAAVAKAGGIGMAGALFLCCGLPMVLAVVAGAAVAAPFARLDSPTGVATASLLLSAGAWVYQRRRLARAQNASASNCGC